MSSADAVRLAVCFGEAEGIGPEVARKALDDPRVRAAGIELRSFGEPGREQSPRVALEAAIDAAMAGGVEGVVTAPSSKGALGGCGHTEILRERSGCPDGLMMFVGPKLRVVTLTEHLPLAGVPGRLAELDVAARVRSAVNVCRRDLGIAEPRVALCGVNPHAGEGGLYGHEDRELLAPAADALRAEGLRIAGPGGADGMFGRAAEGDYDLMVATFHDQGLAPFKALHFHSGVHLTAGLPFPRTSPVHGVARDIAGRGIARPDSMVAATLLCAEIARRRREAS